MKKLSLGFFSSDSILWLICLLMFLACSSAWGMSSTQRIALLIAHNGIGSKAKPLRYAVSDARKIKDVLRQVAGYRTSNIFLSVNQTPRQVRRLFRKVGRHIRRLRRTTPGKRIVLFVYYSGHARRGKFLLGKGLLPFSALRRFIKRSKATLRLAFLDTCSSGEFLRTRGLKRTSKTFHIPILHTQTAKGEAVITSTGNRENAYEDLRLRGGIFTHFMVTGLRGAADRNKDGRITLNELYAYTYNRTINRTVFARSGPQKPHFQTNLRGSGQVILSSTHRRPVQLHLRRSLKGQFFIWDKRKILYAGFYKKASKAVRLAMRPGKYTVQWRHNRKVFTTKLSLLNKRIYHLSQRKGRLAYLQTYGKRGGNEELESSSWRLLESEWQPSAWSLFAFGGLANASLLGGSNMAGGVFGLRHKFFSLRSGIWGGSVLFQGQNEVVYQTQLLLKVRLEAGYRWEWEKWQLFLGGYGGVGFLFQDVSSAQARVGLTLHPGVTTYFTYQMSPRWGINAQVDLGADLGEFAGEWRSFLHWGVLVGISLRL